jgi:hypothetical protein
VFVVVQPLLSPWRTNMVFFASSVLVTYFVSFSLYKSLVNMGH